MIIIDSKKDYYDYLVGLYGRDEGIVYDRRGSIKIMDYYRIGCYQSWYTEIGTLYGLFNPKPCKHDVPRTVHKKTSSKFMIKHYGKEEQEYECGKLFYCAVEIGLKRYFIVLDRFLNDDEKIVFDPRIKKVKDLTVEEKGDRPVVGVYKCTLSWDGEFKTGYNLFREYENRPSLEKELIFSGTWVTGLISPEETYNNIYNYLIATKDKKIEDKRTDEQKAQSHGFNNESFRNPIRVKDLGKVYKNSKKK